jgi:subtilase family serine protease
MNRLAHLLFARSFFAVLLLFASCGLLGQEALAQLTNRIAATAETVPVKNSLHALAQSKYDAGRANPSTPMSSMLMVFAPSAAQQAALSTLLTAQQNPASPLYHQWLTPATYAAQFGMSSQDIATAQSWLEQQGFTVLSVSTARNAIRFSGTVSQVEAAFHTEIHQYKINGATHLANSTQLSLPSGMAAAVAGIHNIAQFHPRPMHVLRAPAAAPTAGALKPNYTDATTGANYLTPNDIQTIYDIAPLYNAGYSGSGESIGIMGVSTVSNSDLNGFQAAVGLPTKNPTETLVPNTGAATSNTNDEGESDIDLEYASAIAPNASIYFYYAGTTGDVLDSLQYAIQENQASILSISYGECEPSAGSDPSTFEPLFMEANAQGQTILASSGDEGATGCDTGLDNTDTVAEPATQGLAVIYPASSAYVTGMGGTEFSTGTGTYFSSTNNQSGGSATGYIPEVAWNETSINDSGADPLGFDSTGGGASVLFGKPSWQVATGVPQDNARDVPDISLDAANDEYGFLYCGGGSCSNGAIGVTGTSSFANLLAACDSTTVTDTNCTIAGGTSFDAPIFAGILALISEKNNSAKFGNINPALYSIYSTSSNAFHDITSGNNEQPCESGSTDCPTGTTQIGYTAGVGYDQVTGLGTIDANNLASIFPASTTITSGSLIATTTTLASSTSTPLTGSGITFTAAVTASAGTTVPSGGTIQFAVNGTNQGSPVTISSGGTATFSYTFSAAGNETVTATYSGTSTYATSSSTLALTVKAPSTGQFTLAATNVTVASGGTATSTLTITPQGGYTGTVDLSYTTPNNFVGCLFASDSGVAPVTGGTAATVAISVDTSGSDCETTGVKRLLVKKMPQVAGNQGGGGTGHPLDREKYPIAAAALLAGFALVGRRRKTWPLAAILMLASLGAVCGLSGCGSSSNSTTTTAANVPAGTYTITLVGTDSQNLSITATTTFTTTVQ